MSAQILDEHRRYVQDAVRVAAFRQALALAVRPGDVVLDLGSGTGILSLLACAAGAAVVYAAEQGTVAQLGRDVVRVNGYGDRVKSVVGLSTDLSLPEPVDVVVTDQIDGFGVDAGLLRYLGDARRRLLKVGGTTIPSHLWLSVAAVDCPRQYEAVDSWRQRPAGFNFDAASGYAANTLHYVDFSPTELLGQPSELVHLDPAADAQVRASTVLPIERAGVLHGIAGWFCADLFGGTCMSNSPLIRARIDRRQVLFPIEHPVPVREGDQVDLAMRFREASGFSWSVAIRAAGDSEPPRATFSHSSWLGTLLRPDDLQRTSPAGCPRRSGRGEAALAALAACDGEHSLGEIESLVYTEHGTLFSSYDDAAAFVAHVLRPYLASASDWRP